MTKQEALQGLEQSKVINVYRRHPAWQVAFDLFNSNNKLKLQMGGCSTCFKKVLTWLRS